jgi:N-acetylglucosamine-6-sulfatase
MSPNPALRGRRLVLLLALLTLACAVFAGYATTRRASAASGKPNVVVVLTDDMTLRDLYETYGSNGKGKKLMPKVRAMIGGKGVNFKRYYASNPISCPSRTTNLTGQYSKNHGNIRNTFGRGRYCSDPGRVDFAHTLPAWLQAAGYRTLHYGRFLNAFGLGRSDRVPEGWDDYVQPVEFNSSASAVYYGYRLNINGTVTDKYGDKDHPDKTHYFTDVMTNMALDSIASGDLSQPFFLALDQRAPHEDAVEPVGPAPALRDAKTLRGKPPRHTPSYNEKDVSDKTKWLRKSHLLNKRQKKLISVRNRNRLRALEAVDEDTAKLIKRLGKLGVLNNTYIIFTSDNGFFNGEHRISKGKYRPYENSSHVPFLIRGPGIPHGRVSSELTMNVDLAPTIVQIAGAKVTGRVMDGRSMLPYAMHPRKRSRRPIMLEAFPPKPSTAAKPKKGSVASQASALAGPVATIARDPTPPNWRAVVYSHWKLDRFDGQGYELYDLNKDPDEINSLARIKRYRPIVRFLRHQLKRLERCAGASCRKQIGKMPALGGSK